MLKFFEFNLVDDVGIISQHINSATIRPVIVNCLNPHSFCVALEDSYFYHALQNSDYLLPDGEGIRMTLKKYRGISINKIAGDDLHKHLLTILAQNNGRVYYMGSSEQVLKLIKERAEKEYPTITIKTLSPSFCDELSEEESIRIINDINEFKPDVLFVSMTAPKQEKWVEKYHDKFTNVKIVASIGAVFNFYSQTVKRAPEWAINMHIEWLVRLLKEPLRMWERNFVSTPRFLNWVRKHKEEM